MHLPPDAAYRSYGIAAIPGVGHGDPTAPQWWSRSDEMMASLLELTHATIRLLEAQVTQKPSRTTPLRIPRPQAPRVREARSDGSVITSLRGFNLNALRGALE